jgi:hypothetical protein
MNDDVTTPDPTPPDLALPDPTIPAGAALARLEFKGSLSIRDADAVRDALRDAMMRQGLLLIDCSGVTEADLTFIQLLIAVRQEPHHRVVLTARPDGALLDTLVRCGFQVVADEDAFWFAQEASTNPPKQTLTGDRM